MRKIYLSAFLMLMAAVTFSQSFVQVIHNSPIPGTNSGPTVDIYLNGNSDIAAPDIPDFAFRTATPFVELPAGPTQIHVVADGGDPATDTVFYAEVTLKDSERYSVIAAGIAGDAESPFGLAVKEGVTEAAAAGTNDLLIFHGSPNAPAVIIDAKDVANLESQLEFGQFGDLRTVPNDDYIVDVRPGSDSTSIVARFQAPLQTLGASGATATVWASGLLGDSPAFGVFATLADGTTIELPDTLIANLQIIHNSPLPTNPGGPAVDIFVNGDAPGDGPLKGLQFREATPFLELPGTVDFTFDVVPAGGTIDQSLFTLNAGRLGNESLTVTAYGIAGDPNQPFALAVTGGARQYASQSANVDVNAFHGATDAPAVDIFAIGVGQVIDSLDFGRYTDGYLELDPDTYYLGVRANGASNTVASFKADLSGLAGGAATVFASGFLANANGSAFGLFAALPSGDVIELPVENVARVQIVHDAPVAESVDIWLGGVTKAVPEFQYKTATPFLTIPIDSSISIAAPGSIDTVGNLLTVAPGTLETGKTYYVAARGENLENFGLSLYDAARESAEGGEGIDLQAFHGSPDAPAVDVRVRNVGVLFPSLVPWDFASNYVNVPEDLYILDVTFPGEEDPIVSFLADLTGLNGASALAFASGFVTSEQADSTFELLVALADGTVVPLPRFITGFANIIHASPAAAADSVDVYIGESLALDNFPYLGATGYVELPVNQPISINVKSSTGPEDGQVLEIPANTLGQDEVHIVIVHGDGTDDFPITASFIDTARATNSQNDLIDVIAFHGIPGVGAVDVRNGGNLAFPLIIENLDYGQFSDYLLLPETEFFLRFTPTGSLDGIATFNNEVLLDDESVVFLATGSVSDGTYNLYVVLPDGSVFESLPQSLVQIIHNSPLAAVESADIWLSTEGQDLGAITDVPFRTATAVGYFPTRIPFDIGIAAAGSSSSADALVSFPVTFADGTDYIVTAIGDVDNQPVNLAIQDVSRFLARDGEFDVQVLHGSPDAPTVDVLADGNPVVDNLEYGTYQGYLGLGANPISISIADETGTTIVGTFDAPVDTWVADGNSAGTIFASGYLTPEGDAPSFGLYVTFSDGTTEELSVVSSVNELEKLLTGMVVMPNPVRDNATVRYSLEEPMDIRMRIYSTDGRVVEEMDLGRQGEGQHTVNIQVFDLAPGTYQLQMLNDRGSVTKQIVVIN